MRRGFEAMLIALAGAVVFALPAIAGTPAAVRPPEASLPTADVLVTSPVEGPARIVLSAPRPVAALHFAAALDGYRQRDWTIAEPGFRWVVEGGGERLERSDSKPFDSIAFTVPQRYRSLAKSYAPFSPFSDGGLLIYSGHYHACLALPCNGGEAAMMTVDAPGRTVRVREASGANGFSFRSEGEGVNVYVGTLAPQLQSGLETLIDPGLPPRAREQLLRSLPEAMAFFTRSYGPLGFTPQLFASIDARGFGDGRESTQGGTLSGQIFIHFDGVLARERAGEGDPAWLEWFFAHEVAHMFQRDSAEERIGDDRFAWMHEGGAEAMAALAMLDRGQADYVATRVAKASADCRAGLAKGPLASASARGQFADHYACGMIASLALTQNLAARGHSYDAFARRWFARLAASPTVTQEGWFAAAADSGIAPTLISQLRALTGEDAGAATAALGTLQPLALAAVKVG